MLSHLPMPLGLTVECFHQKKATTLCQLKAHQRNLVSGVQLRKCARVSPQCNSDVTEQAAAVRAGSSKADEGKDRERCWRMSLSLTASHKIFTL